MKLVLNTGDSYSEVGARESVRRYLDSIFRGANAASITSVLDYGEVVVFCYESNRYLETNDFLYYLFGNAPLMLEKHTGSVFLLGTAYPIEEYVSQYMAEKNT